MGGAVGVHDSDTSHQEQKRLNRTEASFPEGCILF